MSNICIVDLKDHTLDFDKLNEMVKRITQLALNKDLAVFFHSYDYRADIINSAKMKNFFLMSDSFLYKHCDFLDTTSFTDVKNIEKFRKEFFKKFAFFTDILNIIFSYKLSVIDIYVSGGGDSGTVEDFDVIKTNQESFLKDLFNSIIKYSDEYAYGFPTVKLEVAKG